MSPELRNYLKKILILAAATAILILIAWFVVPEMLSPVMPFVLAFFLGSSILSFSILQKKAINEPKTFVTGFLAHTVIRMFVYLIIILGYGLSYRSDAVNFILGFFVIYTIFTFFEVMQFIRLTRNNKITR
jgi:phosphatidylglycerophosphate synthase